jgi:hypothetical protein
MTDTVVLPWLATNALRPSALNTTPLGFFPTGIVARILWVAVLMMDTSPLVKSVAITNRPLGLTAIPTMPLSGVEITFTVLRVARSITQTPPVPPKMAE